MRTDEAIGEDAPAPTYAAGWLRSRLRAHPHAEARTQDEQDAGSVPILGRHLSRADIRMLPLVVPAALGAALVTALAVRAVATSHDSTQTLAELLTLVVAAAAIDAFPLLLAEMPVGPASVANILIVAAAVLFDWSTAALVACGTAIAVEVGGRERPLRSFYNIAVYVLPAAASGAVAGALPFDGGVGGTVARTGIAAATFYVANLGLVTAAVSRSSRRGFLSLGRNAVSATILIAAIMSSLTIVFVTLWQRSPWVTIVLVGPLAAVTLYQRALTRELEATRLALTDALTGLGNQRSFADRLERSLDHADRADEPVSLCLLDVDNFKEINDARGHPVGDRILARVAAHLRQNGEAFRVGGDEFALLLAGRDAEEAAAIATAVVERVATSGAADDLAVSASAGVATYRAGATGREELRHAADRALYRAKERGRNQVAVHEPQLDRLKGKLVTRSTRAARLEAAARLARAVDARDAYTGSHSYMVGVLAELIAQSMRLSDDYVELCRVAGTLHDLGKLAIPEEILRKRSRLSAAEVLTLRRHPRIGFEMLEGLGIEPIETWVLHHHERWDGTGYPDGLAQDAIPLGSRILFVADAFDAMTSERVYSGRRPASEAIAELRQCAGRQFDPVVVEAFAVRAESPEDARALLELRTHHAA